MNHQEVLNKAKLMLKVHGVVRENIKSMHIEELNKGCSLVIKHDRRGDEKCVGIFMNNQREAEYAQQCIHRGDDDNNVVPVNEGSPIAGKSTTAKVLQFLLRPAGAELFKTAARRR